MNNGKDEHCSGTDPVYDPIAVSEAFANRGVSQLRNDTTTFGKVSERLCS